MSESLAMSSGCIEKSGAKLHIFFDSAKRFQLFFRNIFGGDRKSVLHGSL